MVKPRMDGTVRRPVRVREEEWRRGHQRAAAAAENGMWKDLVRSSSMSREEGEESLSQWRWWSRREVGRDEDTD